MKLLSPWMHRVVLISHVALIVAIALVSAPAVAFLLIVPLLLPLHGLFKGRDYTFAWATMLLAFYVGGWLSAGYYNPAQKWISFGVAGLAAVDYAALNMFVRFRARERAARAQSEQTAASAAASH